MSHRLNADARVFSSRGKKKRDEDGRRHLGRGRLTVTDTNGRSLASSITTLVAVAVVVMVWCHRVTGSGWTMAVGTRCLLLSYVVPQCLPLYRVLANY